jgi:hypothetical protein
MSHNLQTLRERLTQSREAADAREGLQNYTWTVLRCGNAFRFRVLARNVDEARNEALQKLDEVKKIKTLYYALDRERHDVIDTPYHDPTACKVIREKAHMIYKEMYNIPEGPERQALFEQHQALFLPHNWAPLLPKVDWSEHPELRPTAYNTWHEITDEMASVARLLPDFILRCNMFPREGTIDDFDFELDTLVGLNEFVHRPLIDFIQNTEPKLG